MTDAVAVAEEVRSGRRTAAAVVQDALTALRAAEPALCATTRFLDTRASAQAAAIDAAVRAGKDPGPLAGVPFGVKDLFDLEGLPTTAGAAMLSDAPPAARDAEAVRRLVAAGAIPVATHNMDAFAYGFATINAWTGTTRNPHDPARLAGGSSGGSAAAVAAGLLPLTLGSDTNGSVRVPAALCGIYGLKPTHGDLPMGGVYRFVDSFDDVGPFAGTLADLRLASEVLRGRPYPSAPAGLRVARLGGWFARNLAPMLAEAIDRVAHALGAPTVKLPEVDRARSAAYLMTAAEGGARHLPALRRDAMAFDPQVRDRLLAGALLPAAAYLDAQAFRRRFADRAAALFARHDVLIAPAAPVEAPPAERPVMLLEGAEVPARAHLGLYTQPLSFIGLPALAVPLRRPGGLPLGLQLVGAPGGEAALFALAERLEREGLTGVTPPPAAYAARATPPETR